MRTLNHGFLLKKIGNKESISGLRGVTSSNERI